MRVSSVLKLCFPESFLMSADASCCVRQFCLKAPSLPKLSQRTFPRFCLLGGSLLTASKHSRKLSEVFFTSGTVLKKTSSAYLSRRPALSIAGFHTSRRSLRPSLKFFSVSMSSWKWRSRFSAVFLMVSMWRDSALRFSSSCFMASTSAPTAMACTFFMANM